MVPRPWLSTTSKPWAERACTMLCALSSRSIITRPLPAAQTALLHERMREFAARHGILLWDVGEGIGHQLIVETGRALPGGLAVGADSHAVTYGALNTFATGIGSSDLAAIFVSGEMWLRVPESIRVTLTGELPRGRLSKGCSVGAGEGAGRGRRQLPGVGIRGRRTRLARFGRPFGDRQSLDRDGREERHFPSG